jgi:hypothetical protein
MCGIVICWEQTSNTNPETWFMLFQQPCATKMTRFAPGQWQQTQLQANFVRKEADIALRASATRLI